MNNHYKFEFRGAPLDPYRICQIYRITHPAHQHSIKKLLRAGRSIKTLDQDIDEVILSLQRWKEMIREDGGEKEKLWDFMFGKCSKCGKPQPPMSLGDPCWSCACKAMIAGIQFDPPVKVQNSPDVEIQKKIKCVNCQKSYLPRENQLISDLGDWKKGSPPSELWWHRHDDGMWFPSVPLDVFDREFSNLKVPSEPPQEKDRYCRACRIAPAMGGSNYCAPCLTQTP